MHQTRRRFIIPPILFLAATITACTANGVAKPRVAGNTATGTATVSKVRNLPPPAFANPNLQTRELAADPQHPTATDVKVLLAATEGSLVAQIPRNHDFDRLTVTKNAARTSGFRTAGETQEVEGMGLVSPAEEMDELVNDPEELEAQGGSTIFEANTGLLAQGIFHILGNSPGWFGFQTEALPAHFDLRDVLGARTPPVTNQKNRNTCVFFAVAGILDYTYAAQDNMPIKTASPQQMFWAYQHYVIQKSVDRDRAFSDIGTNAGRLAPLLHLDGNLVVTRFVPFIPPALGYVSEQEVPYFATPEFSQFQSSASSPNFNPHPFYIPNGEAAVSQLAEVARKHLGAAGAAHIASGAPFTSQGAFMLRVRNNVQSFKAALVGGAAITIGLPWGHNAGSPPPPRFIVPEPTPGAPGEGGGHQVDIVGYLDEAGAPGGGYWIIRNSWGADWGDRGHCLISYQTVLNFASSNFIAVPYPQPFNGNNFSLALPPDQPPASLTPGNVVMSPPSLTFRLGGPPQETDYFQQGNGSQQFSANLACLDANFNSLANVSFNRANTGVIVTPIAAGVCTFNIIGAGDKRAAVQVTITAS